MTFIPTAWDGGQGRISLTTIAPLLPPPPHRDCNGIPAGGGGMLLFDGGGNNPVSVMKVDDGFATQDVLLKTSDGSISQSSVLLEQKISSLLTMSESHSQSDSVSVLQILTDPSTMLLSSMPSPQILLSSMLLVTASDMVPFVPCQPMAISMGATLGIWAYPICVLGQTMAGILAFGSSRIAADSQQVQQVLDGLGSQEARDKFQEFRQLGTQEGEGKVLLALIGLRLAPFFPFSAGNYLLGGGTGVGLRPFFVATLLGCLLSNLLSVSIGIGGSELIQSQLGATS